MTGCTGYNKLLKSGDHTTQYNKALEFFYSREYNKALKLFTEVIQVNQNTPRADTIMFYSAKALYQMGMYIDASEMMLSFMNDYPRSPFLEEAEYTYAMCYYFQSGTHEKDQSTSKFAIQSFNEYLNRYSNSIKREDIYDMIDELTRKLYRKEYENAALYYKLGRYNAAITSLRLVLKEHPEIPYREDMMYLICKSWFDYAENSVYGRQLDRYMKMMDAYYSYQSEYPNQEKRLAELGKMFEKAKAFTEEYGYSRSGEERIDIEARRDRIMTLKDRRFFVKTKEEKRDISEQIKREKALIKEDRAKLKEEKKEAKFQQQQMKNREKQEQKLQKEQEQQYQQQNIQEQ